MENSQKPPRFANCTDFCELNSILLVLLLLAPKMKQEQNISPSRYTSHKARGPASLTQQRTCDHDHFCFLDRCGKKSVAALDNHPILLSDVYATIQ